MIFNSLEFALFIPFVFLFHWLVVGKSQVGQNAFLLAASYFFYGWWDWRFLGLIAFSSLVDYGLGHGFQKATSSHQKKGLLAISLLTNLGVLLLFKYYDFFITSFQDAFSFFGHQIEASKLGIAIPVGISFYTFQTLSYTIDVYRGKIEAEKSLVGFLAYVSFFPQLVAGPIERAAQLLPQFKKVRVFDLEDAKDGVRQMLWGFFKKMVIADTAAVYVQDIFSHTDTYGGSTLVVGAVLFSFQIYCDFSGYSDIAIGLAHLFGIRLMQNFRYPYFAKDIADFWRRWHISLSTWFRDYLYIPLGGSRGSILKQVRNVFIIFLVSGFWHGPKWTYVAWGGFNALLFLPLLLMHINRNNLADSESRALWSGWKTIGQMLLTFSLVTIAWVFFRAESIAEAGNYFAGMCSKRLFTWPEVFPVTTFVFIGLMLLVEWSQRHELHPLAFEKQRFSLPVRWGIYYALLGIIIVFGGDQQTFIYFQF